MRLIDLEPHEYRSTVKGPAPERGGPHEPFWGPDAPEAIGYLIAQKAFRKTCCSH
jgi:hypothetical protein